MACRLGKPKRLQEERLWNELLVRSDGMIHAGNSEYNVVKANRVISFCESLRIRCQRHRYNHHISNTNGLLYLLRRTIESVSWSQRLVSPLGRPQNQFDKQETGRIGPSWNVLPIEINTFNASLERMNTTSNTHKSWEGTLGNTLGLRFKVNTTSTLLNYGKTACNLRTEGELQYFNAAHSSRSCCRSACSSSFCF